MAWTRPFRLALAVAATAASLPCRAGAQHRGDAGTFRERIVSNDNRTPAGRLASGVLTVRLEVRAGMLHPEEDDGPGVPMLAFAEPGKPAHAPGPLLRVPAGTMMHVSVRNPFADSTLTVYGLHDHPAPADTGIRLRGGETREVRFRASRPGTWFYWATTTGSPVDARQWFESQLAGAFVVDSGATVGSDRIFVLGTWVRDGDSTLPVPRPVQDVMVINGRSWPHTERFTFAEGERVHWRWVNPSNDSHPMHLHGFYYNVESRGDWRSDAAYAGADRPLVVTHLMLPGETMNMSWTAEREGNWIFHCHFAFHVSEHLVLPRGEPAAQPAHAAHGAAAPHRMAGLVLALSVNPSKGAPAPVASQRPPRRIRLIAQAAPRRFGTVGGMGYVVHEGPAEPARDSIAIPGPTLVLRKGEPVAITVVNHLKEPTAVHWHGIELESFPDGVPGWSGRPGRIMPAIMPNDSFVAEFVPPRAGTFIYHTHANEQLQMGGGLYGTLLVVDSARPYDPARERIIMVGGGGPADSMPTFGSPGLVNGSAAPAPMVLDAGTTYRLRLININPDWRVIFSIMSDSALATWRPLAKDGADLPASQAAPRPAYLLTGPGETADFAFTPTSRGELRLEVKTQLAGWIVPIRIHVR